MFIYYSWTIVALFDFSTIFSTLVGLVNSAWDPQISLFNNFFIKNGFHGIIHTFKNYFATIFLVFSFQFQQNKFYPNGLLTYKLAVWYMTNFVETSGEIESEWDWEWEKRVWWKLSLRWEAAVSEWGVSWSIRVYNLYILGVF